MAEDFVVAKLTQGDLGPVAVSGEVLEGMETLSKKPVSLPKLSPFVTPRIATFLDALAERTADERGGGIPTTVFSGHVILSGDTSIPLSSLVSFALTFIPVRESISNSRESTGGRSCTWHEQWLSDSDRLKPFG